MKKSIVFLLVLLGTQRGWSQSLPETMYQFHVDLTRCENDQLEVVLVPPKQKSNDVRYCLPKIVPGIYGAMDFGQYVQDFQAFDANKKPLKVKRENTNVWQIEQGKRLARITYRVDDTWDSLSNFKRDFYRSAGAGFIPGEGFVINHNALFGYFAGQSHLPYQIIFRKPDNYYGATALTNVAHTDLSDIFRAPNYRELVDAPIIYTVPDTVQFQVGATQVLISVLNALPGANYPYAPFLKDVFQPQLEAISAYLGDTLPVERYAFLVYFEPFDNDNMLGDALEHNRSSLHLYGGRGMGKIAGMVTDLSIHEFFHIVTPLNLHSEKIAQYDFQNPEESQHLWLYEGMTEYFTLHVQVRQEMIKMTEFFQKIQDKYRQMQDFNTNLSLTDLSKSASKLQDQYYNVYLRGALVNLCLDIRLCELSDGKYNLNQLIRDLTRKYGPDKPFNDAQLFDEITAMTYPEIREFFRRYVEGSEPPPLAEYLAKTGLEFDKGDGSISVTGSPKPEQWKLRRAWIGR